MEGLIQLTKDWMAEETSLNVKYIPNPVINIVVKIDKYFLKCFSVSKTDFTLKLTLQTQPC